MDQLLKEQQVEVKKLTQVFDGGSKTNDINTNRLIKPIPKPRTMGKFKANAVTDSQLKDAEPKNKNLELDTFLRNTQFEKNQLTKRPASFISDCGGTISANFNLHNKPSIGVASRFSYCAPSKKALNLSEENIGNLTDKNTMSELQNKNFPLRLYNNEEKINLPLKNAVEIPKNIPKRKVHNDTKQMHENNEIKEITQNSEPEQENFPINIENSYSEANILTNLCFVKSPSKGSCNSQISVSVIPNSQTERTSNQNDMDVSTRQFSKAHSASSLPKNASTCSITSPLKLSNSNSPPLRNGLTLLEQIVKTHPIWYLQHLGRAATNHLLRPMEVGAFIVRLSSRSNNSNHSSFVEHTNSGLNTLGRSSKRSSRHSTMALSVRLPNTNGGADIDHYIIETYMNNSIRLEGSPNSFKSLPILLEHYCNNGEELQIKLSLPTAILSCNSIQALQAIALMGQDFWTSELALMSSSNSSIYSTGRLRRYSTDMRHVTPMVMHNPMANISPSPSTSTTKTSHNSENPSKPIGQQTLSNYYEDVKKPKMGVKGLKMTDEISWYINPNGNIRDTANIKIQGEDKALMSLKHGPLKKSQSAMDGIVDLPPNYLTNNKVPSHRSAKPQSTFYNNNNSGSSSSGSRFLRNLFSSSTSNLSQNSESNKLQTTKSKIPLNKNTPILKDNNNFNGKNIQQSTKLAECDYFLPYASNSILNSQSDAQIWQNSPFMPAPKNIQKNATTQNTQPLERSIASNLMDKRPKSPLDIQRDSSIKRKGFARLKGTFRMPFTNISTNNLVGSLHKSKDDSVKNSLSQEAILAKQKQMAFRRANTDLTAESVHRLMQNKTPNFAIDLNNNSKRNKMDFPNLNASPSPSGAINLNLQLRKPALDAQQQAIAIQHRRHKIHQKLEPIDARKQVNPVNTPMVPPQGRSIQEEAQAIKKCIDELKNKRLETSKMGLLNNAENIDLKKTKDSDQNMEVVMRNRTSPRKLQTHCSVPNLLSDSNSCNGTFGDKCSGHENGISCEENQEQILQVAYSNKALTAKLGRTPGTGELQTINEGLITPVVRRKIFAKSADNSNSNIEDSDKAINNSSKVFSEHYSQLESEKSKCESGILKETESLENRTSFQNNLPASNEDVITTNNNKSTDLEKEAPLMIFGSKQSRIAIAKVRPQQHVPVNEDLSDEPDSVYGSLSPAHNKLKNEVEKKNSQTNALSRCGSEMSTADSDEAICSPPAKRQSEYAQLSVFTQYFELNNGLTKNNLEMEYSNQISNPNSMRHSNNNINNSNQDEDTISIAETDFNEPWDSNAWENLLDLARFGDEKSTTAAAIKTLHYHNNINNNPNTILEEENLSNGFGEFMADSEDDETMKIALEDRRNNNNCCRQYLEVNEGQINNSEIEEEGGYGMNGASNFRNHHQKFKQDHVVEAEAVAMAAVLASKNGCGTRTVLNAPETASNGILRNFERPTSGTTATSTGDPCCSNKTGVSESLERRKRRPTRQLTGDSEMDFTNPEETQINFDSLSSRGRSISRRTVGYGDGESQTTQSLQRRKTQQSLLRNGPTDLNESLNNLSVRLPSLSPIISPPRLRNLPNHQENDPNIILQNYVEYLARDECTLFGATLHRFIECTIESEETDPQIVIRRVRQFLNGMKNYLVKNGELDLHQIIARESEKLNSSEFLNIDAIFEAVLNKILLVPIKGHLYHLMVLESTRNGELKRLSENLAFVRGMNPADLGLSNPESVSALSSSDSHCMEQVRCCFKAMQNHYSPMKKLETLLKALFLVINECENRSNGTETPLATEHFFQDDSNGKRKFSGASNSTKKHAPAEELTRWLVYLLAKTSAINCEIEAWYMCELLPQQILSSGDASYYLSTLSSAVRVLKNRESIRRLKKYSTGTPTTIDNNSMGSVQTLLQYGEESFGFGSDDAFLRIAVPDEQEGCIEYHTFPILPQMNVTKLCRVIAHQFAITSPEDYGLMKQCYVPIRIFGFRFTDSVSRMLLGSGTRSNWPYLCGIFAEHRLQTELGTSVAELETKLRLETRELKLKNKYILSDGYETYLLANEYPYSIRSQLNQTGKSHLFAYKRNEARIAWPKNAVVNCSTTISPSLAPSSSFDESTTA